MGLAIHIERGSLWVSAEPDRPVLMRHSRKRDSLADKQIPGEQALMTLVSMNGASGLLLQQRLDVIDQAPVPLFVVRFVAENDIPLAIQADAIIGVRQILGGKPKIDGVGSHQIERPTRRNGGGPCSKGFSVQFANEGDMAHRVWPLFGPEIEVVDRERLLKHRPVGAFR